MKFILFEKELLSVSFAFIKDKKQIVLLFLNLSKLWWFSASILYIGIKISTSLLVQVFTTHHWMVRIYKLKPPKNRIRGKLKKPKQVLLESLVSPKAMVFQD